MDLAAFRTDHLKVTLEHLADELGLRSKGYLSDIEQGKKFAPLRLALQIEAYSGGRVAAESLMAPEDRELLRERPRADGAPAGAVAP